MEPPHSKIGVSLRYWGPRTKLYEGTSKSNIHISTIKHFIHITSKFSSNNDVKSLVIFSYQGIPVFHQNLQILSINIRLFLFFFGHR